MWEQMSTLDCAIGNAPVIMALVGVEDCWAETEAKGERSSSEPRISPVRQWTAIFKLTFLNRDLTYF